MVDTESESSLTPAEAAKAVGIGPHTIRRWCEWHAAFLSEGANPPSGAPRQLTWHDVEVLKTVKGLRARGMQTVAVNEKLETLTFATIDTQEQFGDIPQDAIVTTTENPPLQSPPVVITSPEVITLVLQRIETVEKRQRDNVTMFLAGVIVSALFFLLILLLFLLTR